jgi:hypothetical protein
VERGLIAPLSPHEELALRRVAFGVADPLSVRASHTLRLKGLALIEDSAGTLRLTPLGQRRLAALSPPRPVADPVRPDVPAAVVPTSRTGNS